jgi:hypothetical protein
MCIGFYSENLKRLLGMVVKVMGVEGVLWVHLPQSRAVVNTAMNFTAPCMSEYFD